jgi:hypothetical protein
VHGENDGDASRQSSKRDVDAEDDAVRAIEDEVRTLFCQNPVHVRDEGILWFAKTEYTKTKLATRSRQT